MFCWYFYAYNLLHQRKLYFHYRVMSVEHLSLTSILSWITYTGKPTAKTAKWIYTTQWTSAKVVAQWVIPESIWIIIGGEQLAADQHQRHAYGKQYSSLEETEDKKCMRKQRNQMWTNWKWRKWNGWPEIWNDFVRVTCIWGIRLLLHSEPEKNSQLNVSHLFWPGCGLLIWL